MRTPRLVLMAILIGAPASFFLTFLSTPLLWKLEPIFNVELAGHSGPSGWVFLVNLLLFPLLTFWLLKKLTGKTLGSKNS